MQSTDSVVAPPWERMRLRVAALLGAHPLMQDVPTPAVEASRFGVRVRCAGEAVEVARFQWYLPLSDERAHSLAAELATRAGERIRPVAA